MKVLFFVCVCLACTPSTPVTTTVAIPAASAKPVRLLDASIAGFLPKNRARIDALLASRGSSSKTYDPAHPPIATFDWDNTMMRNDIGDATMAYALDNDGILQPPNRDWSKTSEALTPAARAALNAACDGAADPDRPLKTKTTPACATEIFAIYDDGKTAAGKDAWAREITTTTKEPYAWEARLFAGHTPEEIRAMARGAYAIDSAAPEGATRTIGTRAGVAAWVRIYPAMRDLVSSLRVDGFDVWIVSASPQYVSEVVAAEVGIASDHVVGVRNVPNADGTLGYDLESCGNAPKNSVMTFDRGKRCFINRVILRVPEARQLERAPEAMRQVFAAGDSDTDTAFVQDATALKLVIDRNKPALMCNAYSNFDNKWLVQPMFIEPLARRATPYPCDTAKDADGAPLVDEANRPMRAQVAP